MALIKVKAPEGMKIPLEHSMRESIPKGRIVAVEDSHYYRSMINDGDLKLATEEEWQAQQEADAKAEQAAIDADKKAKAAAEKAAAKAAAATN